MATVRFQNPVRLQEIGLTTENVADVVDIYFKGVEKRQVVIKVTNLGRKGRMYVAGLHEWDGFQHVISLCPENIRKINSFGAALGGNLKHATLAHGALQVLVHELQHANQRMVHVPNSPIYKGPYSRRPCEIDARAAADKAYRETASFLGIDVIDALRPADLSGDVITELAEIAECLDGEGPITETDLAKELRLSGLYTAEALRVLRSLVTEMGRKVT